MTDLGTLGGSHSDGNSINDACQVTGYAATGESSPAFIDSNGVMNNVVVDVQSGRELRVSTGATALFFSAVLQRTGALFTGTGTKFYGGGLSIGASPGLGVDAGSVNFGVANLYLADIGGTTACTAECVTNDALKNSSFDKLIVGVHPGLGGTLQICAKRRRKA